MARGSSTHACEALNCMNETWRVYVGGLCHVPSGTDDPTTCARIFLAGGGHCGTARNTVVRSLGTGEKSRCCSGARFLVGTGADFRGAGGHAVAGISALSAVVGVVKLPSSPAAAPQPSRGPVSPPVASGVAKPVSTPSSCSSGAIGSMAMDPLALGVTQPVTSAAACSSSSAAPAVADRGPLALGVTQPVSSATAVPSSSPGTAAPLTAVWIGRSAANSEISATSRPIEAGARAQIPPPL